MSRQQILILVLLLGAQFNFAIDFSILTVALPAIGDDLGFTVENLQWVISSFALTAAGFMLLFGRIGDIVGRKRLFLAGVLLMTVASLAGGLAMSPEVLIAARVAQGLGIAIVTPTGLALITTSFPEGPLRNKALGLNGALLSLGFGTGAVLGGVLTDTLSWRWTFFINVPVGALILIAAPILIHESRSSNRPKLDIPGAVTVTLGLLALVFGITAAGSSGWTDPATLLSLAAAAALLVAFWVIELRSRSPLAPVHVLRNNSVKWGNFGGLITFSMESALAFLLTIYMQQVLGLSAFATGLAFGVLGTGAFVGGVFAPRIIGRIGAKNTLVLGLLIQAILSGSLYFLGTNATIGVVAILVATAVGGFGHVMAIVAYTVTSTNGLPDHEQGLATGLISMTQQIGFTLGIPIMSAVVASRLGSETIAPSSGAILDSTTFAILVDGLIVLVGAVLIGLFLRNRGAAASTPQPEDALTGAEEREGVPTSAAGANADVGAKP